MGPEDKILDAFIYYSHYLNPSEVNASLLTNLEPCGPPGRSISQPPSTLYYAEGIRVEELCAHSQQLVVRVAYPLKCMSSTP
jgi:hypothetical protein